MIPFAEHAARVELHIERAYGIRVITRDVPDPLTGDLNGTEIHIDFAATPEQRLFLLLHLFGHTVQWNTNPLAFELGQPRTPPVSADRLPGLIEYERQAGCYAQGLPHEAGITDADQWLAEYAACDEAYLRHYYLTAEKREFSSFFRKSVPLIEAHAVPRFIPSARTFRSDGIVI
jgi:hypothetical protein